MKRLLDPAPLPILILAFAALPLHALAAADALPPDSGVDLLWQNMRDAELISDLAYHHALQYGALPGALNVNAHARVRPGPNARRHPNKPRRDLSYAARWQHALTRLQPFSQRMRDKYSRKRQEARQRAKALALQTTWHLPNGGLAGLDYFDDLGFPLFTQTLSRISADTISTAKVWPSGGHGFDLTGSPVILGIWEWHGAPRGTHDELDSRILQRDQALSVYGFSDHATTVAGTMIATGLKFFAKGMAYQATLHAYDSDHYLDELPHSARNGVWISNHSWGWTCGWTYNKDESKWYWCGYPPHPQDYKFGLYASEAHERDQFVYSSVCCLPVWSAGNDRDQGPLSQPVHHNIWDGHEWVDSTAIRNLDGYPNGFDTIPGRTTAKNILTVGAVHDIIGGYTQPSDVVMSWFSSFGPTDDGRIRPDLVANGTGFYGPDAKSDSSYTTDPPSGTSFSAPSVAGSLGLLQHSQLDRTDQPLWASTYKGLVIHTADEAGDAPGPDYQFGWGLMNTLSAAQLMRDNALYNSKPHIKEVTLPDGEEVVFHVTSDGTMPLRVTICWTDPPGSPPPPQLDPPDLMLVNDLDLRVTDPSAATHFPWTLDPLNPAQPATTGDNYRDNVEQVHIHNTQAGLYTVTVSHKGALVNDVQDVSILVSGNVAQDIDFAFTQVALTSGMVRLQWTSPVGSIHTVMASMNLHDPNAWTALSDDISIIRETTAWVDEESPSEQITFYRIKEIK